MTYLRPMLAGAIVALTHAPATASASEPESGAAVIATEPEPAEPPPQEVPPKRASLPGGAGASVSAGLRGSHTSRSGVEDDAIGIGASGGFDMMMTHHLVTVRFGLDGHLGGGGAGLDGRIHGLLTAGPIWHLTPNAGAFARIGLVGDFEGNDRYALSYLNVPAGEIGVQGHYNPVAFELGFRTAAAMTGRYYADASTRDFDAPLPTFGIFTFAVVGTPERPSAWSRFEATSFGDSTLTLFEGQLCAGYHAFLCADATIIDGYVGPLANVHARTAYLGLTLAYGGGFAISGPARAMR